MKDKERKSCDNCLNWGAKAIYVETEFNKGYIAFVDKKGFLIKNLTLKEGQTICERINGGNNA